MPVLAKAGGHARQLSGGRVILEWNRRLPGGVRGPVPRRRDVRRGTIVDEGMQALRLLFTERRATFRGRGGAFRGSRVLPKPVQNPMPIYAGGNHSEVRRRAGQYAQGWMPAVLSPEEIERGVADVHRPRPRPDGTGRRSTSRPQFAVLDRADPTDEAVRRFRTSQLFKHLESLKKSTLREQTGGFRPAQSHRRPRRDLRAHPDVRTGGGHHALRDAVRGQSVSEMQEASSCSVRTSCPISARPRYPRRSSWISTRSAAHEGAGRRGARRPGGEHARESPVRDRVPLGRARPLPWARAVRGVHAPGRRPRHPLHRRHRRGRRRYRGGPLACYGKFFFNYADPPGAVAAGCGDHQPGAGRPGRSAARDPGGFGALGKRSASTRRVVFPAAWQRLGELLAGTTIVPAYASFRTARMVKSRRRCAARRRP